MKRVFLGGTCNGSVWREALIPRLEADKIEYFNPVVPDWTPACQEAEDRIKADPETVCLFVITAQMTGVFSIAEVVDLSNKAPGRTIFWVIPDGFDLGQRKSLEAVATLVRANGAFVIETERELMEILRQVFQTDPKRWNEDAAPAGGIQA